MNYRILIASVALAATPALADNDGPIEVNTDGLQSHVAEQVREHAARGEQALMQYMWFTRRMHHLWLEDVTKAKAEPVAMADAREKREYVVIRSYGTH